MAGGSKAHDPGHVTGARAQFLSPRGFGVFLSGNRGYYVNEHKNPVAGSSSHGASRKALPSAHLPPYPTVSCRRSPAQALGGPAQPRALQQCRVEGTAPAGAGRGTALPHRPARLHRPQHHGRPHRERGHAPRPLPDSIQPSWCLRELQSPARVGSRRPAMRGRLGQKAARREVLGRSASHFCFCTHYSFCPLLQTVQGGSSR
jgi:hypothetical protein